MRRGLHLIFSLILAVLFLSPAGAIQDWLFRPYLTRDGLPLENARAVAEDTEGTIWVATWGTGVHALRGTDWRVYNAAGGLAGEWALCIEADDRGGIWVGTADGVSRIRGATVETFTVENTPILKSNYILCLEWTSQGEIWIGGENNEIVSCNPETMEWKVVADSEVTGDRHVEAILQTREGPIWILLNGGVAARYASGKWEQFDATRGFGIDGRRLHESPNGDIWALGLDFPLRYSNREWKEDDRLSGVFANSIADVTAEGAFVGGAGGLYQLTHQGSQPVLLPEEIGSPYVNEVFLSSKGALWIATHDGLIRGFRAPWRRILERDTGLFLNTSAIHSDPESYLWAMGEGNCLYRYDGSSWERLLCLEGSVGPIRELTEPIDGKLWTLVGNEAFEISLESGGILRRVPLVENIDHSEIEQLTDGTVWLLTNDGFYRLDEQDRWEPLPSNLVGDQGEDLVEAANGIRYFCYSSRILKDRDGVFEDLALEHPIFGDGLHFKSACRSRTGEIWFGTYGRGVLSYRPDEVKQFTVEDGLLSNYVSQVYEATDGTLWMAYRRKGAGSYKDGRWLNFSTQHGLPHASTERVIEYPQGSIWVSTNGQLYRLENDEEPPETYLDGAPDHLAYRRMGVVTFSGMDAWERTPRQSLEFSWRVEAIKGRSPMPQWTPFVNSNSALIPALTSGDYLFQVRAADDDRNIDPTPATLAFTVEPPFWLSKGFLISACALLAIALIGGAVAYSNHRAARHSQTALMRAEEKAAAFGRILDGAHNEIYILDEKTKKFLQVNQGAIENLGYSAEELRRMTPFDLNPARTPEDLQRKLEPIMDGRSEVIHYNSRHRRKDGSEYPTEIYLQRVFFESSPALLGVVLDVTEREKAEIERRALEEKIQHTQKLESLGVLAGGIAHDFNNLLMGILGYAGLAQMELPSSSEAHTYLKEIETSGRRAADLCKQMLAYSGKGKFVVRPLDLSELVEEMSNLLNISISKNAVLKYNFAQDLPAIEADPTQIRQVVMNLITNASEALEEKSGIISISTGWLECDSEYLHDTYLDVDIAPGPYVYVEVSDSGVGMDEETRGKLFDPFFTTKFTGRGLGLAAVLGIVRGHGGTIKVYSEQGRGSVFKVLFPASKKSATRLRAPTQAVMDGNGQGVILVVDDEETVRSLSKKILEKSGYQVLTASDGLEGLKIFKERAASIDLVLLDMTMPHLGGEAVFRDMRRIRPDVRVLLSSGYNEQDATSSFVGKGLAGFIQKPYTPQELYAVVARILKERDAREEQA